jgi:hypothetical protein
MRRPGRIVATAACALIWAWLAVPFAGSAWAQSASSSTTPAPQRYFSIGPMLGEPTGVTVKLFNPSRPGGAWEAGVGWSQAGSDGVEAYAQHQWHLYELKNTPSGVTTFYLGLGGRVKDCDGTRFGVRGSIGLNYAAPKRPRKWESFLEVAPIVDVTPDRHTFVNVTAGIRWYLR